LEERFTVRRLGVSDRPARTLTSTDPVESMISIARTTTRNVKRWKDGQMARRWTAAGMLAAERSFRRIKGCKDMPTLVAALTRHAEEVTVTTAAYDAPGRHRTTTSGTSSHLRMHWAGGGHRARAFGQRGWVVRLGDQGQDLVRRAASQRSSRCRSASSKEGS
jgi:hypothetical protein